MFRFSKPGQAPENGWVEAVTPLGASAHVQVNSAAHEMCEDWRLFISGRRYFVQRANFASWFAPVCALAPAGLSAELLMANGMVEQFATLVAADPGVRTHLAMVPDHCVFLDNDERDMLAEALDIVRLIEARDAARIAAIEAARD